ncbi:MAG: zinc ribbon domain-containing protein, partial [Candidatus Helarchaeales archaeon]
ISSLTLKGNADVNVSYCTVTEHNFTNSNINIQNSIFLDAAPVLETLPSLISDANDFLLNWSLNPGTNFTGPILNYTIYRANTSKNAPEPTDSDFEVVGVIQNPNPLLSTNTTFWDSDLNLTGTPLDGQKLWYKVEIFDQGNNHANSTVTSTILQKTLSAIDANIFYDRSLTTHDNVTVRIFISDNDINDDGSPDIDMVLLNYTMNFGAGNLVNQTVILSGNSSLEIVPWVEYEFNFSASYCEQILFHVLINSTDVYQGFNKDYDSRIVFGGELEIRSPRITFSDLEGVDIVKIIESAPLTFSINVLEDADYVENITITYRIYYSSSLGPIAGELVSETFTYNDTEKQFSFTFPSFENKGVEYVEFCIYYFDTAGKRTYLYGTLNEMSSISVYPVFPSDILANPVVFIMTLLGSCAVGVILGMSYLYFRKQAQLDSQKEIEETKLKLIKLVNAGSMTSAKDSTSKKGDLLLETSRMTDIKLMEPGITKLKIIYVIGLCIFIALTSGAIYLDYFHPLRLANMTLFAGVATILLIIAMFDALFIYLIWLYLDSKYSIRKEHVSIARIIVSCIHVIVFLGTIIFMLQVGRDIPWFNYYIVTQSGQPDTVIIISIPTLYIKIISLVFSSLAVFIYTVYWDIRRSIRNIRIYRKQNASISVIMYTKEDLLNKTYGRINWKVLIFLVLLGVSLLPISAEGFFAILPTVVIIIAPAFFIFVLFFFISYLMKSSISPLGILLEPLKKCPKCNFQNLQSARYCGKCKHEFPPDQTVIVETISCPNCNALNPSVYKYCKACGHLLKEDKKPENHYIEMTNIKHFIDLFFFEHQMISKS